MIDKEWFDYEFLQFGLTSETIDGQMSIYTVAICKDGSGYVEEVPLSKMRFVHENGD
jgi:hypothetical protein